MQQAVEIIDDALVEPVEWSGCTTDAEFARFVGYSYRSLKEVMHRLGTVPTALPVAARSAGDPPRFLVPNLYLVGARAWFASDDAWLEALESVAVALASWGGVHRGTPVAAAVSQAPVHVALQVRIESAAARAGTGGARR